jgi:hypothetical protein
MAADGINVADADGGNQASLVIRRNTTFWYPSWSPRGDFILFASDLNGPGIYSMRIDRNSGLVEAPQLIISLNSVITKAAWSPATTPDGKNKIAYGYFDGSKYSIYLVDVVVEDTNGTLTLGTPFKLPTYLPGEEFDPSWSPDASKLAVTTFDASLGSWGINIFDLTTGVVCGNVPLCEVFGSRRDLIAELGASPFDQYGAWGPSWANTGNKIAVNGIPQDGSNGEIWVIEFDDDPQATTITNLTNTNPATTGPNGSPDGNEVNATWSPDDLQIMYQGFDYLCAPQKNEQTRLQLEYP